MTSSVLHKTRTPGIYWRVRANGHRTYVVVVAASKDGKRTTETRSFRSEQEARRHKRQRDEAHDRGVVSTVNRMTVHEFAKTRWLPHVEATLRPNTSRRYRGVVEHHILPAMGGLRLREVVMRQGKEAIRQMIAGASPGTAGYVFSVLSSALEYAAKDLDLIPFNPCRFSVKRPEGQGKEARVLEEPEAQRMLSEAQGNRLEAAIALGLFGGTRIAEAVGLRWGDLDFETGKLTIERSFWGPTKSGKPREVVLPEFGLQILRRWKSTQRDQLQGLGIWQTKETAIVTNVLGQTMAVSTLDTAFRKFCSQRSFAASFHTLRHTFSALQLVNGVDARTIAGRMGHADGSLVLRTYGHLLDEGNRQAANALGARFS